MILGEVSRATGIATTLDDLFRRAGVRHPNMPALVDPPNRESFTDGAPRVPSYAQADRAISAVAARLRALGLQTDAVIAIQLPNTVDSIIAFLGVLRRDDGCACTIALASP
ncbi:MAG: AMP-binding protein [Hyphomicrobiales bacterium]